MAVEVLRRHFTAGEYHRMAQAGILHEDDRVELIEGEIVEMAPIGSRHAACVIRLTQLFSQYSGEVFLVNVHNPISLSEHSEPQPDVTLLRPRSDYYADSHPGPEDILLVIEVCDTCADYDRGVKVPLYGRSGIGEVWLVDLAGESIEVYRSPNPEGYDQVQRIQLGQPLGPEALPDLVVGAADILPRQG